MEKSIYHYQDTRAMTRSLLAWVVEPDACDYDKLSLSENCGLEVEATCALVASPVAQTLKAMEFTEIYFSPEQLAELLQMPVLEKLQIWGGVSYDWIGPEYVYPTLGAEHLDAVVQSPHASRLRVLELDRQSLGESTGQWLRRSLPHLEVLTVERQSY